MSKGPEQISSNVEYDNENQEHSAELFEKLASERERSIEQIGETQAEKAEKAKKEALEAVKDIDKNNKEPQAETVEKNVTISKKQKNDSYKKTLKRVQSELKPAEKVYSKVIHNDTVEKSSEFIGNSVARPNSILCGAVCAFLLTLLTYFVAKKIGYRLSGSETIVAFVVGWVIGSVYDYLHILLTGKK